MFGKTVNHVVQSKHSPETRSNVRFKKIFQPEKDKKENIRMFNDREVWIENFVNRVGNCSASRGLQSDAEQLS